MSEYSFLKWLSERQMNEARLVAGAIGNPFDGMSQKEGDFVYFGIHDLIRSYKQLGHMPPIDMAQVMQKAGRIENGDPIKRSVFVACNVDPYKYGYHRIETKSVRDKRKLRGGPILVEIKSEHLENINYMMEVGQQINADNNRQTLWLAFDGSTQLQRGLIQEIRKEKNKQQVQPNQQNDPDKEARVKQWLHGNDGTATVEPPIKYTPATLWKDPVGSDQPQYQVNGRNVIDTSRQQQYVRDRLKQRPRLDVANYDPFFNVYNGYWKSHNDARQYEYVY
jgi:hypothetical protein